MSRRVVALANPYLRCTECFAWVEGFYADTGELVPCIHPGFCMNVCTSWSPVDGCCCEQSFGIRLHPLRRPGDEP